jgi:hypothetical protein
MAHSHPNSLVIIGTTSYQKGPSEIPRVHTLFIGIRIISCSRSILYSDSSKSTRQSKKETAYMQRKMPLKQDRWSIAYLPSFSLLPQTPASFLPSAVDAPINPLASCCGNVRPRPPENQAFLISKELVRIPSPCLGLLGEAGGGRDHEGRETVIGSVWCSLGFLMFTAQKKNGVAVPVL